MKKRGNRVIMRFIIWLFIGLMICNAIWVQAQIIDISTNKNVLKVNTNTYTKLSFSNNLNHLKAVNVKTKQGTYSELRIGSYGFSYKVGYPKLPVLRKLIEVPVNSQISVRIVNQHSQDISAANTGIKYSIIPGQPHATKDSSNQAPAFQKNEDVYSTNAFVSSDTAIVTVEYLGTMRGVNIARLNISPVAYNPVTRALRVYDILNVEVTFKNADVQKTIQQKLLYNSPYFSSAYKCLINYKPEQNKSIVIQNPVKYVIVSDSIFRDSLQPFVKWKRREGYNVIEAYNNNPAVGKTATRIKNYLTNLYNSATETNPAPSFILFVGDVGQIPSFKGSSSEYKYDTDLPYCDYTGDYLPDVLYGRFSANNLKELQPQIDKTLEYEEYTMPDPSYLNNALLIAGNDVNYAGLYANGQMNYASQNYFTSANGFNLNLYKYPDPASATEKIIENLNSGSCFANYSAHGAWEGWMNPPIDTAVIAHLTNKDKYGLMIGNACYTQAFYQYECFGESVLRAKDKGAIGYIGATSETYWDEDYWWSTGFGIVDTVPVYGNGKGLGAYDRLFHTHGEPYSDWMTSLDGIVQAGNLAVTESGSQYYQYYWEIYSLMGDPSLNPYLAEPGKLSINYNETQPLTSASVNFTTEPYTYIGMTVNDSLIAAVQADSNGVASINFSQFNKVTTALIVATRQNRIPFKGFIKFTNADSNTTKNNDTTGHGNLLNLPNSITANIQGLAGKEENNDIIISWETLSEKNNYFFVIERSADNINYTEIGTVPGAINSVDHLYYSFSDEYPEKSINYYRIKLADLSGNYSYSVTEPVNVNVKKYGFDIYPNPSDGQNINIQIKLH